MKNFSAQITIIACSLITFAALASATGIFVISNLSANRQPIQHEPKAQETPNIIQKAVGVFPAIIQSASYKAMRSYNQDWGQWESNYYIEMKVKNVSNEVFEGDQLAVRVVRRGRPLPDHVAFENVRVIGGLFPGESGEIKCRINATRLGGKIDSFNFPDGGLVQVSFDDKNWIEVAEIKLPPEKTIGQALQEAIQEAKKEEAEELRNRMQRLRQK